SRSLHPIYLYYSPTSFPTRPPPPSSTLFPYTTLFRSIPPNNLRADAPQHVFHSKIYYDPAQKRSQAAAVALKTLMEPAEVQRLRSEEHTSELQSRGHLVCRLLLEKKNKPRTIFVNQ